MLRDAKRCLTPNEFDVVIIVYVEFTVTRVTRVTIALPSRYANYTLYKVV